MALSPGVSNVEQNDLPGPEGDDFWQCRNTSVAVEGELLLQHTSERGAVVWNSSSSF